MHENNQPDEKIEHYILTDDDGNPIPDERYKDDSRAIDARARLMTEHPDGDNVTVEVLTPMTNDNEIEHTHDVGDILTKIDTSKWRIEKRMVDVDTRETLYRLRETNGDFSEIMTESQLSRSYNVGN